MNLYILKKIALAIIESYKTLSKTSSPKLIMTLLVKNEEDMLEISINKYFKENTHENKRYKMLCEKWDKKPIHPKVKLDNFIMIQ